MLQIYQTKYLKEVEAAAAEGRPVQEFGNFIAEVNRSNVYRTSAFMAKVHGSVSSALAEVELALASESLAQMVRESGRMAGISAGDVDEEGSEFGSAAQLRGGAEDRRGPTRVYARHEEVVSFNPEVGEQETDYVLKTHYRTIAFKESKDPSSFEQSVSAGHIYYELVDLSSGASRFFSAYPEKGSIVYGDLDERSDQRDIFQHKKILEYMQSTGKNVLFSKVMHVTKEQFDKADKFASNLKGKYVLGGQDCSDVGPRLLEELGMSVAHYAHLFKDRELSKTPVGLKIKGSYGHRDAELTFKGTSREDVAERYRVSVDRVQKKYDIKPEDKRVSMRNTDKDMAYLNTEFDQEYVILPAK